MNNPDLFLTYSASAGGSSSRRRRLAVANTVTKTDGNLVKQLSKEHTLALITVCGSSSTGKVDGVQLEYGLFDAATSTFTNVIQGDVHGSVSGSGCLSWHMNPTRTITQVVLAYNFFQVNYIAMRDSIPTEVPLSTGLKSGDSFESQT